MYCGLIWGFWVLFFFEELWQGAICLAARAGCSSELTAVW